MSITIATQTRRYTVKLDEPACEEMFDRILIQMIADGEPENMQQPKEVKEPAAEPDERRYEVDDSDLAVGEPEYVQKDEYPIPTPEGYSGFLHLKCEHCGQVHAFCAKHKLTYHKCPDCGNKTSLEDLTPLYMRCECGQRSKYLTNMDEFAFDINCIECGSPVPVKYNNRKKIYETIE